MNGEKIKKALSEKEYERLRVTVEVLTYNQEDVTFTYKTRDEVRRQTLFEITENIKLVKKFSLDMARKYISLKNKLLKEGY